MRIEHPRRNPVYKRLDVLARDAKVSVYMAPESSVYTCSFLNVLELLLRRGGYSIADCHALVIDTSQGRKWRVHVPGRVILYSTVPADYVRKK